MMRTIISVRVGTRHRVGTDWPVLDEVRRCQLPGKRPTWVVLRGLCNGVPDGATEHATQREALAEFRGHVDTIDDDSIEGDALGGCDG